MTRNPSRKNAEGLTARELLRVAGSLDEAAVFMTNQLMIEKLYDRSDAIRDEAIALAENRLRSNHHDGGCKA